MKIHYIGRHLSLFILFITLQCATAFSQSKSWSLGVGTAISSYDFISSSGNKIDYLKKDAGNSYAIGYEQTMLDTTKFVGLSTPKAIYFLKHKTISTILTKLTIGAHVLLNQYNAVGNVQNLAFDYQTNYAGLQLSIGPKISLGKKWHVLPKGLISGQHILQGNQHVNFSYVDLTKDSSFNGLKTFLGYEIRLEKQINNALCFYISGANNSTYISKKTGVANLNFQSIALQMGIKISSL